MNYCNKCGDPIEPNEKYCNKCGNPLQNTQPNTVPQINNSLYTNQSNDYNTFVNNNNNQSINSFNVTQTNNYDKNDKIKGILIGVGSGIGVVILLFVCSLLFKNSNGKYYFDTNPHENNEEIVQNSGTATKKGKYSTAIIYDNTYSGVSISQDSDAYKLIEKDSVSQKNNCPTKIKNIENDIIKKYGIIAVNLCEMDVDFAREIGNVIKTIYDEYPSARGFITNLSLANVSMSDGYIAAFMPIFNFATSDSSSTYPWVIKTQVLLNSSFFLNRERLLESVKNGTDNGHFPPNTTMYSPIAHEFGHYLSFLALMSNLNVDSILLVDSEKTYMLYEIFNDFSTGAFSYKMIKEAYENYKMASNTFMSLDEWRGTISQYALAKDNDGNYIWDETIAESFHDVYLNGNNAKDASKYIIAVLKSKLGM